MMASYMLGILLTEATSPAGVDLFADAVLPAN